MVLQRVFHISVITKTLYTNRVLLSANRKRFSAMAAASKKALLVLTEGAEEMELVITADVLRRAKINVTIAGLDGTGPVKCSRDVVIVPDDGLANLAVKDFDAFILPGGLKAANTFAENGKIGEILKDFEEAKKVIAVICASPIALDRHNIGLGKMITSHPSMADRFSRYRYVDDRVVNDDKLITSRGPGTAFDFALEIVKQMVGADKVQEIAPPMILK